MDIDKLFKVPKLPAGSNKRRMPDNPTPEMLKKMKFDTSSFSAEATTPLRAEKPQDKGKSRAVTVEDEGDGDVEPEAFAPGGDADYFAEEDEEGRFFGGGLTSEQKEILNIFDHNGGEGVRDDLEALTATGVRRLLTKFERAANKNQDQRSKYPDAPARFIESEVDLDAAIKSLLPLAQDPIMSYPELLNSGAVERLIGLLSHENADIVIDIVEVIHELTDEDVGNEGDGDLEGEGQEEREQALKNLIEGLLANSILELLVDNLGRLNEAEESDRSGVFHILGIFENILGFNSELGQRLVEKTSILPWLLNRLQGKTHTENRGYAAELLSILLQTNRPNRLELAKQNGIEITLKVLSQYRRRDPANADETEFMENVFDSLCSALGEPEIKKAFMDCEGVDLMVLMMKDKMQSRSRSIKVLDHAMSGIGGMTACETFVEALGLKILFSTFMGKPPKKQKARAPPPASEDTSHTLGIISSLFSNLPLESPARIRLLAKFVENNYEKADKLLEVRDAAQGRLKTVEKDITAERNDLGSQGEEIGPEEEDMWYLRRLDGGLFTLQTVDYILAWIAMEDDGIQAHLQQMLSRRDKSLRDVADSLQVYHDNVDEDTNADADGSSSRKEILRNLIAFLQ